MVSKAKRVNLLHRQAMDFASIRMAPPSRAAHTEEELEDFDLLAYLLERLAADMLRGDHDVEPTRSVFYRSAGWCAHACGLYDEAIEMAHRGLEGKNVPTEIKHELEELIDSARSSNETH